MNREVGLTILYQLGGLGRLSAMIGINNVAVLENGVRFKFKGCRNINCLEVILDPSDTYSLTFYKLRKFDWVVVEELEHVYADMLQDVFESVTGLRLTLVPKVVV
jgi:hypothetical protein